MYKGVDEVALGGLWKSMGTHGQKLVLLIRVAIYVSKKHQL